MGSGSPCWVNWVLLSWVNIFVQHLYIISYTLHLSPIVWIIFSYTVHARAAIRVLLSILGASPVRNPPQPCCLYMFLMVKASPLFAWSSCILVLITSAG